MPEKSFPPTLIAAFFAAVLAGIMQLATLTLLALKLRRPQMAAAFVFSTILGGIVTVLLLEQLKWPPFIAGSLGAASGMAPAILVPFLALRGALKKANLDDPELASIVDGITRPQTTRAEVNTVEHSDPQ